MNASPPRIDACPVETFAAALTTAVYSVALRKGPEMGGSSWSRASGRRAKTCLQLAAGVLRACISAACGARPGATGSPSASGPETVATAGGWEQGPFCRSGGPTMTEATHLWAIGHDDDQRAEQVRAEINRLDERQCLILLDTAVVVRYPDGALTVDGEPFVAPTPLGGHTLTNFLAGLALAVPPLTGAAVGALVSRRAI